MNTFVSTGGLGDALIVFAKIAQEQDAKYWHHGGAHSEHDAGVKAIQNLSGLECFCHHVTQKNTEEYHRNCYNFCDNTKTKYISINTKIIEMQHPFLDNDLVQPIKLGDICIQITAGRMTDSTKRTVHFSALRNIIDKYPDKTLVLIGPERLNVQHDKIVNMTAQTDSILDALAIVGGSDMFVGHDGVCAYYAAFRHKKCFINYHDPRLINHYYNAKWNNVTPMYQYLTIYGIS